MFFLFFCLFSKDERVSLVIVLRYKNVVLYLYTHEAQNFSWAL